MRSSISFNKKSTEKEISPAAKKHKYSPKKRWSGESVYKDNILFNRLSVFLSSAPLLRALASEGFFITALCFSSLLTPKLRRFFFDFLFSSYL